MGLQGERDCNKRPESPPDIFICELMVSEPGAIATGSATQVEVYLFCSLVDSMSHPDPVVTAPGSDTSAVTGKEEAIPNSRKPARVITLAGLHS
jgi:hypothetical protein